MGPVSGPARRPRRFRSWRSSGAVQGRSFLTETALYRYATPHFYTVDEFPRDKQDLRSEVFYASPWKGGWWRLADACRYMYQADMAVLTLSTKYREQMTYNKYRAARDTIEQFRKDPPYAYSIPREQHD